MIQSTTMASCIKTQWYDTVSYDGMIVGYNGMIVNYNGMIQLTAMA